MAALETCEACGQKVSVTAKSCPACGHVSRRHSKNQRSRVIGLVLLAFLVVVGVMAKKNYDDAGSKAKAEFDCIRRGGSAASCTKEP